MNQLMTEQESRTLWDKLRRARTAEDLHNLYKTDPFLSDEENWEDLGGRDNNEQVWNTQKRGGVKALSELTSNCRDALTMAACRMNGIDPYGSDAPRSTQEAIDVWFSQLKEMSSEEIRDWCVRNNFLHFLGSSSSNPFRVDISDNGVGVRVESAEEQLCSLHSKEKVNCLFQTGEKSAGGTAVLRNCGDLGAAGKMLTTRHFSQKGPWIWTLQRLVITGPSGKLRRKARYFRPGGKLPTFSAERIYTLQTPSGADVDTSERKSGMLISLFDYRMEKHHAVDVDSEYILNFTSLGLPQLLLDSRPRYGDVERDASEKYAQLGFFNRLLRDLEHFLGGRVEDPSKDIVVSDTLSDSRFKGVFLKAFKLPKVRELRSGKGMSKFFVDPRQNNKRVFISRRGQVNASLTKSFITQICKLPALENRIAILVDGDNFSERFALEYFEASRDKGNSSKDRFDKELEEALSNLIEATPEIGQWHREISDENAASAASISAELLSKLEGSDEIRKLLESTFSGDGGDKPGETPDPGGKPPDEPSHEEEPIRTDLVPNPTYIRVKEGWRIPEDFINARIGGRVFIPFDTDAEDSFYRPANPRKNNPGDFSLIDISTGENVLAAGKLRMVGKLRNGTFKCSIYPVADGVKPRDEFFVRLAAHIPSLEKPVLSDETIKLKISSRKTDPSLPQPIDKKSGGLKLPNMVPVTKDGRMYPWFSAEGDGVTNVQSETHTDAGIPEHALGKLREEEGGKSTAYINMSLFDEWASKNLIKLSKHDENSEGRVFAISANLALVKAHAAYKKMDKEEWEDDSDGRQDYASITLGEVMPMLNVLIPKIRKILSADAISADGDDED